MKHVWALLIKFTAIAIVLFSLFGIFNTASVGAILFLTIVTTAVAYLVGDLYILPKFGNVIATVADFGLSFVVVWFFSAFLFENSESILWTSFISALSIAAVEALFHLYMNNHVFSDSAESFVPGVYKGDKMMTEFSKEFDVKKAKAQSDEKERTQGGENDATRERT